MNTVTIDGVSSNSAGLFFDKIPFMPAAKERVSTYAIPGAGEDLTISSGDYDDIQMILTAYLRPGRDIQAVYDWAHSGTKLVLSTQPDIYGEIRQVGEIAPSREGWQAHKIDIPFTLSPFKYRVDNSPVTLTEAGTLRTLGNIYSLPEYVLSGTTGDITFTVNGTTLTVTNAPGNIHINVGAQMIYTLDGNVQNNIMSATSGNFWEMVLVPGNVPNSISWSGTVGSVTVVRNERWV